LILLVAIKLLHARDLRRESGRAIESESQSGKADEDEGELKIKTGAGESPRTVTAQL
jgi:hypothetical protein